MLLVRADISPGNKFFRLSRIFQFVSVAWGKEDTLFIVDRDKDAPSPFKGKGFKYISNTEVKRIFNENITLIIFFSEKIAGKDKKLLKKAEKLKIPTAIFSYMGKNPTECDYFIDPTPDFTDISPGRKGNFTGADYFIMHNKYIHFNGIDKEYGKKIKNILISMGDNFPYRELRNMTETLINIGYGIKIIPGDNFKKFNRKTLKRIYPGLKFTGNPESYARSFYEADLAIITPDESAYRAAATGTPAIYYPVKKDETALAISFEENGAGILFRRRSDKGFSELTELLKFFTQQRRKEIGITGKRYVDGKGIFRLAKILKSSL